MQGTTIQKLSRKFTLDQIPTRITGALHEDLWTFMAIYDWVLLRI